MTLNKNFIESKNSFISPSDKLKIIITPNKKTETSTNMNFVKSLEGSWMVTPP